MHIICMQSEAVLAEKRGIECLRLCGGGDSVCQKERARASETLPEGSGEGEIMPNN